MSKKLTEKQKTAVGACLVVVTKGKDSRTKAILREMEKRKVEIRDLKDMIETLGFSITTEEVEELLP